MNISNKSGNNVTENGGVWAKCHCVTRRLEKFTGPTRRKEIMIIKWRWVFDRHNRVISMLLLLPLLLLFQEAKGWKCGTEGRVNVAWRSASSSSSSSTHPSATLRILIKRNVATPEGSHAAGFTDCHLQGLPDQGRLERIPLGAPCVTPACCHFQLIPSDYYCSYLWGGFLDFCVGCLSLLLLLLFCLWRSTTKKKKQKLVARFSPSAVVGV